MNKDNFRNTCVFAVCGALSVTLLGVSALSFARTVHASTNDTSINIELEDNLYNGLVALSDTKDYKITDTQNLYILINGKEYPVSVNEDGQLVAENVDIFDDNNTLIDETEIPLSDIMESSNITIDENGNKVYHIVWGDTLSELAVEFGNTVNELAIYNNIANPDLIYAEDDLYLPD